ncbi:MAG: hypothetical protein AAF393_16595 [Pseudomonadota bacterium]
MLKSLLSRFRRSEFGGTTVEFMIVMPLIVFWFGGTFTFFQSYSEWTRSVKATYTVADILSRQLEVDDAYIEDMNTLYASIMGESTNDTWLRVSSIEMTEDGLNLDWSNATGLHFGLNGNSEIPTELIPNLIEGETVILVESHVPMIPFQNYIGIDSQTLQKKVAVSPRFNSKLAWNN